MRDLQQIVKDYVLLPKCAHPLINNIGLPILKTNMQTVLFILF